MKKNAVGNGVPVKRDEGARFLGGRGQYLGDLRFPGMKDVAFLRSPPLGAVLRGRLARPLRRWAERTDSGLLEIR
jgi:CO/xanthine dehydrogenase Mo-binding subunit